MRLKCIIVMLILLFLFRLNMLVYACCEGDPPGNPSCYKCEDGRWVLADYAQCGANSDCTGQCHSGCSNCLCQIDPSKCSGCKRCMTFSGSCQDDDTKCSGCQICQNGVCVDWDLNCSGCQSCEAGVCLDDKDKCSGCQNCVNASCVDDDVYCYGCQACQNGACVDDNSKCNTAHCNEICAGGFCIVCGGDTSLKCCPDGTCVKPCELEPTGHCDTSLSDDYKCPGCDAPGLCPNNTTRVYTGNDNYSCLELGCAEDCVWDDDVHCYTTYDCAVFIIYDSQYCFAWIPNNWRCVARYPENPGLKCHSCHRDPDDPGEPGMIISRKCVE